jgi:hypothetical protein
MPSGANLGGYQMKLRTLECLIISRQRWVAAAAARQWTWFMRISFLTTAADAECGVLAVVAGKGADLPGQRP